jgi:hypothetical protein
MMPGLKPILRFENLRRHLGPLQVMPRANYPSKKGSAGVVCTNAVH